MIDGTLELGVAAGRHGDVHERLDEIRLEARGSR